MKKYNISVEATLEVIGGKWKCVILCHLTHGKKRTSELKRLIPSITQKMLTQQLRELEHDGIINRIVYNQVPPKVEYELSEYGKSLESILTALCNWGDVHIERMCGDRLEFLEDSILNK
ncbi:winged helix-turn-helix transcriptional regulator [Listeria booriae]|uniref:Winged helix-turn-helix transcriptional regulator n=1 Tax=Listeria booriae TaxID=1552123 RepID=A0A7X0XRZ1_9LIST|nr:winged helix-turn-helix transcriptional regulator [Listeria booriae]MBC1273807.1 winged helix-turn-helix transcriptional regulator [Listeria booriae]MBC1286747.1 winged helix-turn-helix transcriptional regulator [Listeria booriae]MBC1331993.1 winged helix-turn-helix transcriptional regulator [Listeria booriae]MBC1400999.1 winged helix-turn-helix transcriptional regulator [Listeria booriae]MBC1617174.1 winged helix-turn-helix transcriptional regulator [Listeria booriae]